MIIMISGIKHTRGEYKGYPYDNYNLTCLKPAIGAENFGHEVIDVAKTKIKAANFHEVTGIPVSQYADLVGCQADVYFDEFGRLAGLRVVNTDKD